MHMKVITLIKQVPFLLLILLLLTMHALASESDWMQYGGDEGGGRYSALSQINRDNVGQLEVAWKYKTGHLDGVPGDTYYAS